MYWIKLEIASNGIIKSIIDDNANGAGEIHEEKVVYEIIEDDGFESTIRFLVDLCEDLGIKIGSDYDKQKLVFRTETGRYVKSIPEEELKKEIKKKTKELDELKEMLKNIKNEGS